MSTKEGFDVSRTDYIQALLRGDAALNQYLDPVHEKLMPTFQAYESPDEEDNSERSVNPNLTNHPIFPIFSFSALKRRRVIYYVPISVAFSSFDALLGTGACLSAMPLSSHVLIDPLSKFRLLMVITVMSFLKLLLLSSLGAILSTKNF